MLNRDDETRIEFFDDIWNEFSNTDCSEEKKMIYSDWMELMRLAGVMDTEDDDSSILSSKTLIKIFNFYQSTEWAYGTRAMLYADFALACQILANYIYESESDDAQRLKSLCINNFYVNLLKNHSNFAMNYRANIRQVLSGYKLKTQQLMDSPFRNLS